MGRNQQTGERQICRMKGFRIHGSIAMHHHDQILYSEIEGPWNLELIEHYRERATSMACELAAHGAWAAIIEIRGEAICPLDALEAIRQGVHVFAARGRVCTAYVIAPDVKGAAVSAPIWRSIYAGVMPFEIFDTRDAAVAWCRRQLAA